VPKYNILKALEFDKLSAATKKKYKDANAMYDAGWWLQMKYDGVFGKAVIRPNSRHEMLSRTGEPITSANHILAALAGAADYYAPGWDSFVVLGELWHPALPFPTISGDVRRHRASPHLCFVTNDILTEDMATDAPYVGRFSDLARLVGYAPAEIRIAPRRYLTRDMSVMQQAQQWVSMGGYDGAILRDPDAPYTIGDAKRGQIVKVKPKLTLDLRVKEWSFKEGEKTGRMVPTLLVEYRGVKSWVGAGIPHAEDVKSLVGGIVEIECLGITTDGKLREPVYKGIRHDKLEPDT
jgi:ATP-dependent DNA ligase